MSRRFRPTDAFVDESIRGQRYLLGCVLVDPRSAAAIRLRLERLVMTGGRLHFHNESSRRKRELLDAMATMPVRGFVVVVNRSHGVTEFVARAQALATIVERLQRSGVSRLVLESRQDDRDDQRTINRVRRAAPPLVFEHRAGGDEPLLWLADGISWAVGAGDPWRAMVGPIVKEVVNLA